MKSGERRVWDVQHKEHVGRRLLVARQALGKSRTDWQKLYGLYPSLISQWESGTAYPDIKFLICLCEDYGLTLDYFYRGSRAGVASSLSTAVEAGGAERSPASMVAARLEPSIG